MTTEPNIKERILRLDDVKYRTGLSRTSIYRFISENKFPKPINLSVRSVGWAESEIDAWVYKQILESRNQA